MNLSSISSVGIALDIFTFIVMILMVLFHFFFASKSKIKTNKTINNQFDQYKPNIVYIIFHSYYYWLIMGSIGLLYFWFARWSLAFNDFFSNIPVLNENNSNIYNYSVTYSKLYLLDLCPAVAFLLPLSLIVDPTRNFAKIISPYAIIGSIITIYSTTLFTTPYIDVWDYIFLGESGNEMFFMMHFNSLVLAIGVMLTSKKYTRYSVLSSFIFICLYIGYVKAFVDLKGVSYNTTGVSKFDWYDDVYFNFSEYGIVYQLFPIGFPLVQIISYIVAVIISMSLMLIKNYSNKDINKNVLLKDFWYQKIPVVNNWFYWYDLSLDIVFLKLFFNAKKLFKKENKCLLETINSKNLLRNSIEFKKKSSKKV